MQSLQVSFGTSKWLKPWRCDWSGVPQLMATREELGASATGSQMVRDGLCPVTWQ